MKTPPAAGTRPTTTGQARLSGLAEQITGQVLAALREGVRPWQQPWEHGGACPAVRPLRHGGQPYRGINVLILWLAAQERGYGAPLWMTYRQAQEYGGQVRRGEHGVTVVYADRFRKTAVDEQSGEEVEESIPFLRTYTVFNVQQIDGLPEQFRPAPPPLTPAQQAGRVAAVEAFFRNTGAVIRHTGDLPCYILDLDEIRLPAMARFPDIGRYYGTLAHELVHWTRHPSRLHRDLGRKEWGDAGYAREELVAELGSAFLCADLGLIPAIREDHAPYIGHWLKVLEDDPKALFRAAAHAERAVAYLHSLQGTAAPE